MSKVKKYSRHILVLFLAFATVLTCMFIMAPQAEAAETTYKWRIQSVVTNKCNTEGQSMYIYTKALNGTGESKSTLVTTECFIDEEQTYTYEGTTDAGYFPYAVEHSVTLGFSQNVDYTIDMFVWNNNTSVWVQIIDSGNYRIDGPGWIGSTKTGGGTDSTEVSNYPYATSMTTTYNETGNVIIPSDGSSVSRSFTVAAVDQYGVSMVGASAASVDNNVAMSITSATSANLTYPNAGADYTPTVSVTWPSANSSYSSGVTFTDSSLTVRVPRTVLFDNIFNYNEWRNKGITASSSKAEINEITSTGFTVTSTHSDGNANDGYINFSGASGYYVPIEPGETYTLIADIATVDSYYDIFFQFLDANKEHISYVNSSSQNWLTATAPSNAAYVAVRFDPNNYGNVLTVNNIRMYKHDGVQEKITVANPGISVAYGGLLPVPSTPERTAYTFLGWYDADGNQVYKANLAAVNVSQTVTSTLSLTSKWEATKYDITFDVDGGSSVTNLTDKTIEDNIALPATSKTGYTFDGWVPTASVGNWVAGTVYSGDLSGMYGDVTLKAKWTPIEYTITYVVNGGTAIDALTYTIEDEVVIPAADKTGYTFNYWTTTNNTGNWTATTVYAGTFTNMYGNVTLNADYTIKRFTVKWLDDDGSVLETDQNVAYGTQAEYNGTDPSKAATAQYTYTWTGWDKTPAAVTEDVSYTATYDATVNTYTVIWMNGTTIIETDENVPYGTMASYDGATPTKDATDRYTYTFTGWDKEVAEVTGNITYNAKFSYVINKYTVYWVNDDGSELETDYDVVHGELPSYDGAEPTKDADAQYTYYFKAWSPSITIVSGDVTYTATYDKSVNTYAVTFYDEDGTTVLDSQTLEYGAIPVYKGATPTKAATAEYTYTFDGWDKEISSVTGEASYIAKYAATKNSYTITWYDEDGTTVLDRQTLEYGATPVYGGETPSKTEVGKTWTFEGWDNEITTVTGNASCKATYSYTINKWTVTWVVTEEDVASTTYSYDVAYGTALSTIAPVLAETPDGRVGSWIYDYVTMPDCDITIYADYADCVISWIVDGVTVKSAAYDNGASVTGPANPTKAATVQYTYVFSHWVDEDGNEITPDADGNCTFPAATTDNVTYTAVFAAGLNAYQITFLDEDGTELHSGLVDYGTDLDYTGAEPSKSATAQYTYTFAGWSDGTNVYASNEIPAVAGNATYTATYTATVNTYVITWVDEDGTELDKQTLEYGATPSYKGTAPSKASTEQYEYTFSGWSPKMETVTGAKTYKAVYTEAVRKYRVTWMNGNLTLLIDNVEYGTKPEYTGATPTKAPTDLVAYEFAGWDKEIVAVTGEAVYYAQFNEVDREFYVYFYVDGVNVATATTTFGQNMKDFLVDYPVPEKEGYTGFWTIVPETMPAMDITLEAVYNPKSYSVTITEDSGTTEKTATFGEAFSYVFTSETIPTGVRVTVNGATINSSNYVYNPLTGELTIYGSAIKGAITVTARYTGGTIDVIVNIYNGASTNTADSTAERTAYHTQIVPAEGYLLPKEVKIYIDGAYTADGYTYDSKTGKLTVNAEIVVGSLEIFTECPEDPNYNPDSSTDTETDTTDECNCSCHSESAFVRFFFKIICFLRMIFGMDEYRFCDCGAAHW